METEKSVHTPKSPRSPINFSHGSGSKFQTSPCSSAHGIRAGVRKLTQKYLNEHDKVLEQKNKRAFDYSLFLRDLPRNLKNLEFENSKDFNKPVYEQHLREMQMLSGECDRQKNDEVYRSFV